MNTLRTEIVWDVLKQNDKLLLILPNISCYKSIENEKVFDKFQDTIKDIMKNKSKYIVVHIQDFDYSNETLRLYETFFNIELQWIDDLSVFHDMVFMEYHIPTKFYILNKKIDYLKYEHYFTRVIVDDLHFNKDDFKIASHFGKCYINDLVNIKLYFNKLSRRLKSPLSGMHQDETNYDISLIIGHLPDNYPYETLKEIIAKLIKQNQCSHIYCINNTLMPYLKTFKKTIFQIIKPKVHKTEYLIECLKTVSYKYSTHVFIGNIPVTNKNKWDEYYEVIYDSIFDPFAYDAMAQTEKTSYIISLDILKVMQKFLT